MTTTDRAARPRLVDVAGDAGVSLATVSKVLNGHPDVAGATRTRIERALDERGYRRRGAAAARLVEIVFEELDSAWSMEVIKGVESVARTAGASVVLTTSGTRHAPGPEWVEGAVRRRPLGVVLVFSNVSGAVREKLDARSIPFVVIDPAGDPPRGVPSVGSANWSGGLTATRHLLERGHQRIAVVTGPADTLCSLARLAGFHSAMSAAGVAVDPALVRYGDFHVGGGRRAGAALLDLPDRPTAVFAGSDLQALGILEAARERGLRVPEDLSVVGYDDVPVARWCSPGLTTVHQPLVRMAEEATRLLFRLRSGDPDARNTRVELTTHLVVRDSTATLRS